MREEKGFSLRAYPGFLPDRKEHGPDELRVASKHSCRSLEYGCRRCKCNLLRTSMMKEADAVFLLTSISSRLEVT
jgi:hypothetical protein